MRLRFLAMIERNFSLIKRYLGWEAVWVFYSIVNALCIGFIGVSQGKEQVMYLVVGALVWGFLSLLFHELAEQVQWERWEGTIEYSFMAPMHRLAYLLGNCFYAIVYGVFRSALLLGVLAVFLGLSFKGANILGSLVVLIVSGLSFMGLGLIAAILPVLSTERGAQATHIFQALILLVSGVYYEISVLPKWVQPLSVISPATYTLRAIRAALLEGATFAELAPTILLLAGVGVVLVPIGFFIFTLAERWAKRKGKLKRNG
ncbi:ABC transporter permease [candidate division WOR-3 bacterium]|nr:ABC transporter permease [candidate division WOR-3 bacterium]